MAVAMLASFARVIYISASVRPNIWRCCTWRTDSSSARRACVQRIGDIADGCHHDGDSERTDKDVPTPHSSSLFTTGGHHLPPVYRQAAAFSSRAAVPAASLAPPRPARYMLRTRHTLLSDRCSALPCLVARAKNARRYRSLSDRYRGSDSIKPDKFKLRGHWYYVHKAVEVGDSRSFQT